jgi:hypothetical protein
VGVKMELIQACQLIAALLGEAKLSQKEHVQVQQAYKLVAPKCFPEKKEEKKDK